jgi:O-antigen/teichoic acid export membrane protein
MAVFVLDLIILVIISRVLGPEGKGIYTLVLLVPGMILNFGNFGLASANVYFVGSKKYPIKDIVANSVIQAGVIAALMLLFSFIIFQIPAFKNFVDSSGIPYIYLWIVIFAIPFSLLSGMLQNVIRGREDIYNYNKITILQSLTQLILIIFFLLLVGIRVSGALMAYIGSIGAALIFTIILVRKISAFSFSFNKKLFKDSLSYGMKVYLANMVSFLNYRLDMVLTALFLNPAAIGIYSISVGMAEKLFMIPSAVSVVLFPRISSSSEEDANNFTPKIVRNIFFVMIIVCLILIFLAYPAIYILFGVAFKASYLPFLILLPGIVAFSIGGVLASDLSGRGKPQYAIYASVTCLIANVILNVILIPRFGVPGAAFSSAISYWADTFILIWAFKRISKKPYRDFLIVKKGDFKDYLKLFKNLMKGKLSLN